MFIFAPLIHFILCSYFWLVWVLIFIRVNIIFFIV